MRWQFIGLLPVLLLLVSPANAVVSTKFVDLNDAGSLARGIFPAFDGIGYPQQFKGEFVRTDIGAAVNTSTLQPPAMSSEQLSLFLYLFTPIALFILAVFSWFWALKFQVRIKTAELHDELDLRKRTELELRTARDHLTHIIDSIADPVFVKDRQHNWIILNDAVCRLIGHSREELLGKTDYDFFPAREADVFHARDEAVFETGREDINEEFLTDATGYTHTLLTKKTLYTDSAGNQYIVGIISDITERKKYEDEILRLSEELEQRVLDRTRELEASNRELESFTYSVSHDLRAPLRAIDGFSSILLSEKTAMLSEPSRQLLVQIRKNTQHMAELIDDLLNFSRAGRQVLNLQWINPSAIIDSVVDQLHDEQVQRSIAIKRGELPLCYADATLMHQVFYNLLSNALKFSRSRDQAVIEIGSFIVDGTNGYFIRDNGIGFDMKFHDKIFGVFQRLHLTSEFEGTGVGLAIVQRIIHRHGGRVWAEGEEGKGATFYFTLGTEVEREP